MNKILRQIFSPDLRLISGPVLVIIFSVLLLALSVSLGYSNIVSRMGKYKEVKVSEKTLTAKLDVLKTANVGTLDKSNQLVVILPEENPAAVAISQIKAKVAENSLTLEKIQVINRAPFSNGIDSIQLNYELESDNLLNIVTFLENIPKLAPFIKLESSAIANSDGLYTAKIRSLVFWAKLPESLPTLTEPLSALSDEELNALNNLSAYIAPNYQVTSVSAPVERESPFY